MSSSRLGVQLASLNSGRLVERTRRKGSESYLFGGRDADGHDVESLHALAASAFAQISALNPALAAHGRSLLSDSARLADPTLLPADARDELDGQLKQLLPRLGKHLMDVPTGRVIEWLVRKFRVHEFNVPDVLALFLPYHDSPHFTKMASILHVKNTVWAFLASFGHANVALTRRALVHHMMNSTDVARFVVALLPNALKGGYAHRTLVGFHTGIVLQYLQAFNTMDANTTAVILPPIVDNIRALGPTGNDAIAKDVVLSSYLLLSSFSSRSHLTPQAISALLTSLTSGANRVTSQQFVAALLSVLVPQDLQPSLPPVVLKRLVELDDASELLVQILGYAGSEKLFFPLSTHLVSSQVDKRSHAILKAILAAKAVPPTIILNLAGLLLKAAVDGGGGLDLLSDISQRHADALDTAARQLEVQALLLSLAQTNGQDATLASMDTQDTLRAAAVTDIYKRLDKASAEDLPALHTALHSRLTDPSPEVLRALYSTPQKLVPVVLNDVPGYISNLAEILPTAETEALKLHLDFLLSDAGSGCTEAQAHDIFARVLFPLLLFTRDRRTADVAWRAISSAFESGAAASGTGILAHPMLAGCVEVLEEVKAPLFARTKKQNKKPLEKGDVASMGGVDLALASRMADNLMLLNDPSPHRSFLLEALSSTSPHARALSSLVLRAYIGRLSGAAQIATAQRVIDALSPGFSLAALDEFVDINAMLSDEGLGGDVSGKVKSEVVKAWLGASLLATCAAALRPAGAISFIAPPNPYASLALSTYTLLNTSRAPPTLSAHILRTLFVRLGSDALALLAGVWLGSKDAKLQHTALAHTYAYLVAHTPLDTDTAVVDFQTILPALLVAFTSPTKSVRQAASHCLSALGTLCRSSSASAVYAFDSIYGAKSKELQYLDWADMRKFVTSLCAERLKFVDDGEGLRRYLGEMLGGKEKSVKKKLEYKQTVLVFLLSHATACPSTTARLALLRLTQPVRSVLKARTLWSLLEEIADGKEGDEKVKTLAMDCVDASCVGDLEEDEMWGVFVKLLGVFVRKDAPKGSRDVLLHNLQGFASSLSTERRFELVRVLLKLGTSETELAMLRPALETLLTDARLVSSLLSTLQPPTPDTVPRAAKRAKVDASSAQVVGEVSEEMAELSALADVLGNAPLAGSVELLSALLETLGRVVKSDLHKSGLGRKDAVYMQQRLMSALERSSSAISTTVSSSSLRVDVLVEILRSSDAPQTSHQALLLLASLAKLAPESVLVNVMPVFTFMGSNVLGRDDSYSFRVIQKTVDSIVPVMVEDLKTKYCGKLELAIGARDFVRVFTDAANHIPRHRRTQFFMHLTDVLGPSDLLGLVCMLFISKTANKVVRQASDDLLATVSLPLALIGHRDAETQRAVFRDVLEEARRLVQAATEPDTEHRVVLNTTHDDEQNSQSAALLRRRAQALLVFVGLAVERSPSLYVDDVASTEAVNELLSSLLDLAQSSGKEDGLKEIRGAAQTAIGQALRVVPATSFIAAVGTILDVPKPRVQLEALSLLTERISLVTDEARKASAKAMGKIVGHLKGMLAEQGGRKAKELVPAALGSLRAVAASAVPGEKNALVETLPLVINQAKERENVGEAVAALVPLSTALGPRIIPHFRDVVRECIALLRSQDLSGNVHADALSVLRSLFSSIPSFWSSSQLTALFSFYIDASTLDGLRAFARQIASKAQASVLLPALFDVWTRLEKDEERSAERCATYFELAKRVFRAAQRPALLEHLRAAFGVLLAGLNLRGKLAEEDVDEVEEAVVGAFVELVTKLNETAFRPLFRRLFDWAFGDAGSSDRKIAFLHAYSALLDNFKALMTPYLSIVLEPLLSVLDAFVGESEEEEDGSLWAAALDVLAKSLAVDEGAFWRADKLAKTLPRVVAQTPVAAELGEDGEAALAAALSALCGALAGDAQVKSLNLSLLMHTRDEEARVRLCALRVAAGLWTEHGDQLMGFTGETATFVAECAEDENDEVVRAARKLKEVVERGTGEKMDV